MIPNIPDAVLLEALAAQFPRATAIDYLGAGGCSTTYRLVEPTGSSAIKVLRPQFDLTRTDREITGLRLINSPFVSRFIDEGSLTVPGSTVRYIRTEFLSGQSLRERLVARGPLSYAEDLRLGKHVARGLLELQQHGLTHRDLKPENVMLDGNRFVIIDLGLAKLEGAPSLTIAGDFVGTPQYAALEQLLSAKHVDIRADLFSLGMMLFEAVHGSMQVPYHFGRGQSRAECIQNLLHIPPPGMNRLGSLSGVVSRLIAVQAYQRLNTPAELIREMGVI
jgi:serine/threonine protein kinase